MPAATESRLLQTKKAKMEVHENTENIANTGNVWTELNFLAPLPRYDVEKPYSMDCAPPPGMPRTNVESMPFRTRIRNARGLQHLFKADNASFEWFQHELTYSIESEEMINKYMHEMEDVLKEHVGAKKVFAYDYVLRQQWEKGQRRPSRIKFGTKRPILGVHLDIAAEGAEKRIRFHLPKECDELLEGTYRIMNCWRPLIDKVENHPLAVCDSRSLSYDDVVPSDVIFPHLQVSAFEVWYNPRQEWYFLDQQKKNEVLLMTNYDSTQPEVRCAHTSFEDPTTRADAPERQSIEVRFMVFGV